MRSAHRLLSLAFVVPLACSSSAREVVVSTASASPPSKTSSEVDARRFSIGTTTADPQAAPVSSLCPALCRLHPSFWRSDREAVRVRDLPIDGRAPATVLLFVSPAAVGSFDQMESMNRLGALLGASARFDLQVVVAGAVEPATKRLVQKSTTNAQSIDEAYLARLGVEKFPETWVMDHGGRVRAKLFGARTLDDALFVDFVSGVADGLDCDVTIDPGPEAMVDRTPKITGPDAGACAPK